MTHYEFGSDGAEQQAADTADQIADLIGDAFGAIDLPYDKISLLADITEQLLPAGPRKLRRFATHLRAAADDADELVALMRGSDYISFGE